MVHGSPLNAPVITLGEKKSLFGEKAQANEYVSYALYYWPDPANPDGPYKPIDGKKNKRLRSMDDSGRMAAFISTVCSLGRQYKLDRDPQAASRAGQWLKAWFIAPATRMQPHLKYAQIRPGHRTEGDGGGIIDLYRMPEFLEALAVLKCSNALTAEEWKQVDTWLNQYYTWLTTSRQGRHAHTRSNNHYLFYVAQCAHLASFLGRSHEAAQWLAEAFANMDRHMAPSLKNSNGRNPGNTAFTLFRHGDTWCILQNAWAIRTTVTGKPPPGLPFKKLWTISCLTAPLLKHGPGRAPGQTLRSPPSLNRSRRAGHNGNAPEPRPPSKASIFPAY